MKTKSLLFSLVMLLAFGTGSFAKEVTLKDARQAAKNYFYERVNQFRSAVSMDQISISETYVKQANGKNTMYIFNMENGGWVIISADDVLEPVIGYSYEGSLDNSRNNTNFESFLTSYADEIGYAYEHKLSVPATTSAKWEKYTSTNISALNTAKDTRNVDPLIIHLWNQDSPYNALCPAASNGPGGHVYAGCVATAMSMVMYYYRYPLQGTGNHSYYMPQYGTISANFGETTYAWDAMLNSLSNSSPEESIHAVAEIQFHCGVAVNMGYSPEGSGAYSYNVPSAIKSYFGYDNSASYKTKDSYSLDGWYNLLKEDLDAGEPLYYSGQSSDGGHAFCCDGYQGTEMFHFNFGWSGSGNGFFKLYGSGAVGGFGGGQGCVHNFIPPTSEYPYNCNGTKVITTCSGTFEDGSGPIENYESGVNCSYLFTPDVAIKNFKLKFNAFDLAAGDMVTVYDGEDETAAVLGEFTGSSLPSQVETSGDRMFITFTSTTSNGQGFQAEYTPVFNVFCSGITNLTDPTGTVSDGSGDNNYNNGSLCRWKVMPDNCEEITFSFTKLDLPDGEDNVKIYDLDGNTLVGDFTGTDIPADVTTSGAGAFIVFQTNGTVSGDGFELTYEVDNVGMENNAIYNHLSIYPNPAVQELNIRFDVKEATSLNVQLMSINGEIVYQEALSNHIGEYNSKVDVSSLSKGIYVLHLTSNKGTLTQKVMVD